MSDERDPFAGVVPIRRGLAGEEQPERLAAVSRMEARQRGERTRANRGPGREAVLSTDPVEGKEGLGGAKRGRKKNQLVATPELERMVSTLLRQHFRESKGAVRSQDKKNATVAFAVLVDKFQVLRGKPSQIVGFAEAEAQRPGLVELAKIIAAGG